MERKLNCCISSRPFGFESLPLPVLLVRVGFPPACLLFMSELCDWKTLIGACWCEERFAIWFLVLHNYCLAFIRYSQYETLNKYFLRKLWITYVHNVVNMIHVRPDQTRYGSVMQRYRQNFVDNPIQQEISVSCKHLSPSLTTTCDDERVRGKGRGVKAAAMECGASRLNIQKFSLSILPRYRTQIPWLRDSGGNRSTTRI